MRFVVVGGGSMGRRRIRCLLACGVSNTDIRLVEIRQDRREECRSRHGVESLRDLEQALDWEPDAVIISTPTRHHMEYCLQAARARKDFFCEIGLSHDLEGTEELLALIGRHKLIAAMGIQTPYHPVVRQAKGWLLDPAMGRPLIYHFSWGNYLPNWHPWEHYTDFYDPTQIMGVLAEDLGQLYSFLEDRLVEVFCRLSHVSALKVEGPDCIQVVARTHKGTAVTLQFDLLQDVQQTEYRIVCENGALDIRLFPEARVRRSVNADGKLELFYPPKGYQYEQCYVDEFAAFLKCLQDRSEYHHPASAGVHVLKCLAACEHSNREGRLIPIEA